jgi:asparagine synthase (glutamine-hydrolysing)
MSHSLEIRVPFLDKDLVDYVLKIKPKDKFGIYNKQILADISKDILPHEIIDRPKMGFVLPFEYWFRKNIDRFNIEPTIKEKFKNKQVTWARFWAMLVLEKFNEKQ